MKDWKEFYAELQKQVPVLDSFATRYELVGMVQADHIGYKCDSVETFERIRRLAEAESNFLYQSIISKRRIAIIGLKQPLQTAIGDIRFLELSDQKPDGSQKNGFDHAEIFPVGISYDGLVRHLADRGADVTKVERPHHTTFDLKLEGGFSIRLTPEPLIEKIKREEMK